jgi:hypothetical protein
MLVAPRIIAHRGLINGMNRNLENKPKTIDYAIENGFEVEIDVWIESNQWYFIMI